MLINVILLRKKMQEYKWDAEEYKKHSGSQQLWAQELLKKLDLQSDDSVLDIGCGDGKITAGIASRITSGRVVGIDNSPEMIKLSKKNFPEKLHKNLRFDVLNASNMTFNREFDIVFSNAALHWIQDHLSVLKEILNSLKNGGIALLQMGGKYGNEHLLLRKGLLSTPAVWI